MAFQVLNIQFLLVMFPLQLGDDSALLIDMVLPLLYLLLLLQHDSVLDLDLGLLPLLLCFESFNSLLSALDLSLALQ